MRTMLFCEDTLVDLTRDMEAELVYAIDDIRNIGSKNTAFSKTITIPGTPKNNRLFGHVFEASRVTDTSANTGRNAGYYFNPARACVAVAYVDNIQVFKGILRLREIITTAGGVRYEAVLLGELGGFMAAITGKLLTGNVKTTMVGGKAVVGPDPASDLDFSAYNHGWTTANIVASWPNAGAGQGYYYPLVDYGNASTAKHDFDQRTFRPALFVREYLNKIIAGSGYTYDSAFFDTAFFKRLIVPGNTDKLYKLVSQLLNRYLTAAQVDFLTNSSFNSYNPLGVPLAGGTLANFTSGAGNTEFTYTGSDPVTANLSFALTGQQRNGYNGADHPKLIFRIRRNGVDTLFYQESLMLWTGSASDWQAFGMTGSASFELNPGDILSMTLAFNEPNPVGLPAFFKVDVQTASMTLNLPAQVSAPANPGDSLNMNMSIPQAIQQRDFFLSVCKLFNLYVTEDKDKHKHLHIEPYPDYYNLDARVDWSGKVDRSEEIRLTPMSELQARYFNWMWEQDSDFYNEAHRKKYGMSYGDFYLDTSFEFATEKKEIKVIFGASPLIGYTGEDKYFTPIYKKESSGAEQQTASKIRILQAKHITGVTSWAIKDGVTTLATITAYGYAGHLNDPITPTNDLNWGAPNEILYAIPNPYPSTNLFNSYYSGYMAEVVSPDSKLWQGRISLNAYDVWALDFRKGYIIDGVLYRLNKVNGYVPASNGPTKVELLKVIELKY